MAAETNVHTARLILRIPEQDDAEALMGVLWDPELVESKQVTLHEPPAGLDLAQRNTESMRNQWHRRGYGQWVVVEKSSGAVIGCVGFYHPQEPWPGVDFGWAIHRSHRGRGIGSEASAAALAWLWQHTALDTVISLIAPDDLRSIRIATKIGLTFAREDVDPLHGEAVHVYAVSRAQA